MTTNDGALSEIQRLHTEEVERWRRLYEEHKTEIENQTAEVERLMALVERQRQEIESLRKDRFEAHQDSAAIARALSGSNQHGPESAAWIIAEIRTLQRHLAEARHDLEQIAKNQRASVFRGKLRQRLGLSDGADDATIERALADLVEVSSGGDEQLRASYLALRRAIDAVNRLIAPFDGPMFPRAVGDIDGVELALNNVGLLIARQQHDLAEARRSNPLADGYRASFESTLAELKRAFASVNRLTAGMSPPGATVANIDDLEKVLDGVGGVLAGYQEAAATYGDSAAAREQTIALKTKELHAAIQNLADVRTDRYEKCLALSQIRLLVTREQSVDVNLVPHEKVLEEVRAFVKEAEKHRALVHQLEFKVKEITEQAALDKGVTESHWDAQRFRASAKEILGNPSASDQDALDEIRVHWAYYRSPDTRAGNGAEWTAAIQANHDAHLEPIPLILHCPGCSSRHIDEGEQATTPHRTHACQECGLLWAPAVIPTVGVKFLPGCKNGETT